MMTWSSPMMTPPSLSQVTWVKAPPHAPEVLMDGLLMFGLGLASTPPLF
jgi:hypothetical protein